MVGGWDRGTNLKKNSIRKKKERKLENVNRALTAVEGVGCELGGEGAFPQSHSTTFLHLALINSDNVSVPLCC